MATDVDVGEPIDSDIDVRVESQRWEFTRTRPAVLLSIALGGGIGSVARYWVSQWMPTTTGHFPWATFCVNVSGSFLLGVLMVLITEVRSGHPLLRPFFGVGVLGGFTTFSTYAVEISHLLRPGSVGTALVYLGSSVLCSLLAVILAVWFVRWCHATRHLRKGS